MKVLGKALIVTDYTEVGGCGLSFLFHVSIEGIYSYLRTFSIEFKYLKLITLYNLGTFQVLILSICNNFL